MVTNFSQGLQKTTGKTGVGGKIARKQGINITSHKDIVDIGNKFVAKTVAENNSPKERTIQFYDFSTIQFKSNAYIDNSLMHWCETEEHVEFPSFISEGKARSLSSTVYYMHKFYCLRITKEFPNQLWFSVLPGQEKMFVNHIVP